MDSSKAMVPKAKWSRKRINPFISFRLLHLCLFLSIGKISSPLSNMQRLQLSLEQKYKIIWTYAFILTLVVVLDLIVRLY